MGDFFRQFLEAALPVRNLDRKQILMVAVARIALQIFVGAVAKRHCRTRQDILNPLVEASLLLLRRMQRLFDRRKDGSDPRPVGLGVTIS